MIRTFIAAFALVSFALPALASEKPEPIAFSSDGVDYLYTVMTKNNGDRILKGTADRAKFRLVVGKRNVRGTVDGRPVSFSLAEVRTRTERERLAAR